MTPNGDAMRAIRAAQKMSLRRLEHLTGLDRGYLSRLERGLIREPADEKVQAIAQAMKVPPTAITHKESK